jgi:hypothetical protein
MYGGCYPEALHLGKKRAKQYCTCAVKMVSKNIQTMMLLKLWIMARGIN